MVRELGVYPPLQGCSWGRRKSGKAWLFPADVIIYLLLLLLSSHSVVSDSATPWAAVRQASLSFTISRSLLKLMSIESVMPSNHFILCQPLLLLPSIFATIRVFYNKSVLHIMWPKYWSFSCSISPSNEYSGLISFRIDWFDLLAVQGTLKSLLQYHSSKALILWCLAFFIVQLSHPYMTTGIAIALTRQTFVDKVMSLLFNLSLTCLYSCNLCLLSTYYVPGPSRGPWGGNKPNLTPKDSHNESAVPTNHMGKSFC